VTPKSRGEKSHSGIPGSKAACAYPGLIAACRALLQLSSRAILQTAWHVGPFGGICLAFGENLSYVFVCVAFVACAWCHFEFRFFVGGSVHPSRRIRVGAALHLFLMMYPTFAGLS
jgi:hypothetical protein